MCREEFGHPGRPCDRCRNHEPPQRAAELKRLAEEEARRLKEEEEKERKAREEREQYMSRKEALAAAEREVRSLLCALVGLVLCVDVLS